MVHLYSDTPITIKVVAIIIELIRLNQIPLTGMKIFAQHDKETNVTKLLF